MLAVEALPTTMDALAETYHAPWSGAGGDARDIGISSEEDEGDEQEELGEVEESEGEMEEDEEEPEENAEEIGEDEEEPEEDAEEIGEGEEELMRIEVEEGGATVAKIEEVGRDDVGRLGTKGIDISDSVPQSNSKSRRKRLRRRQQQHANLMLSRGIRSKKAPRRVDWTSRGRHGRYSPPSGPELTTPFLTWLLWLEHCQRASAVEPKARSAARAFVVRAGALDPVLGACFRVLKVSQVAFMSRLMRGREALLIVYIILGTGGTKDV